MRQRLSLGRMTLHRRGRHVRSVWHHVLSVCILDVQPGHLLFRARCCVQWDLLNVLHCARAACSLHIWSYDNAKRAKENGIIPCAMQSEAEDPQFAQIRLKSASLFHCSLDQLLQCMSHNKLWRMRRLPRANCAMLFASALPLFPSPSKSLPTLATTFCDFVIARPPLAASGHHPSTALSVPCLLSLVKMKLRHVHWCCCSCTSLLCVPCLYHL